MEQVVEKKHKFFVGTLEKRNMCVIHFLKNLRCTPGN